MRKLRIHIDAAVAYRDFDLPDGWDDLSEHQQCRIERDLGDQLGAEVVTTLGEVVEVEAP